MRVWRVVRYFLSGGGQTIRLFLSYWTTSQVEQLNASHTVMGVGKVFGLILIKTHWCKDIAGIATVANSLSVLTKHALFIKPSKFHSWAFISMWWKFMFIQNLNVNVHSSFICNSQKLEWTQMSFSRWNGGSSMSWSTPQRQKEMLCGWMRHHGWSPGNYAELKKRWSQEIPHCKIPFI